MEAPFRSFGHAFGGCVVMGHGLELADSYVIYLALGLSLDPVTLVPVRSLTVKPTNAPLLFLILILCADGKSDHVSVHHAEVPRTFMG